jgi:hypothetical protein
VLLGHHSEPFIASIASCCVAPALLAHESAMNISYPPDIISLPPAFEQLGEELPKAAAFLLIPTELLYFSIYFRIKSCHRLYAFCTFLAIAAFWISPLITPVYCGPARCLQNFASEYVMLDHFAPLTSAVAIGTMKLLDIFARRNSLPKFTAGRRPADWLVAFKALTELRYESFTPNHIRVPKHKENFSEPTQLSIHIAMFAVLQALPQTQPTILAFEVLLAIYILWTSMQLLLRYKSSPALFGPLYRADSLTGFWSETWHNAFASPCTSLAYSPLRYRLPRLGVPIPIARSLGVFAAFGLMAIFHMYALAPILPWAALQRIGIFFLLNGVATVSEAMVWGKRRSVLKAILAWAFEISVATWTAKGLEIPNGLSKIDWRSVCDAS